MQTSLIASLTGDHMEAAVLLLLFVILEFGLTIWLLARHKLYLDRVKTLEDKTSAYAGYFYTAPATDGNMHDSPLGVPNNFEEASQILDKATPEQLEMARKLMDTPAFTELMHNLTRANDV